MTMEQKTEMMPIGYGVLVLPYETNPYAHSVSEEGFKTTDGSFINEDSGDKDKMDQNMICGQVVEVGPKCDTVRTGDDVIYTKHSTIPIPFLGMGMYLVNEPAILTVIGNNLKERF